MSLNFPSSPSLNQQSAQNGRMYQWNGYTWDLISNIANHSSSHTASGSDPITIVSSQVTNFNSSVSGLLPNAQTAINLYLWSNFK